MLKKFKMSPLLKGIAAVAKHRCRMSGGFIFVAIYLHRLSGFLKKCYSYVPIPLERASIKSLSHRK
jgi:hypothetical protein